MPEVKEGHLTLRFPRGWQLIKYDDSTWHRQQMKSRLKAMDILAHDGGPTHWWIEVKDCEGFEEANRPRLSASESPEVTQTRLWVEQQGIKHKVQVARRKPFIVDEVEEKLRDTLAAITIAQREANPELEDFAVLKGAPPELRIVLLLTWHKRDFRRLAIRLQEKLNQMLSRYGMQGYVVNEQNIGDAGLICRVIRSEV